MANSINVDSGFQVELCKMAVREYFIHTDSGNFDVLIDYFADDAEFNFLGQQFKGREEIKVFMERDRGEDKIFHHVTDTTVLINDSGKLVGRTSLLVHFDRWETNETGEKINTQGVVSGIYHDEFIIEDNRAKVKKRTMEPRLITQV